MVKNCCCKRYAVNSMQKSSLWFAQKTPGYYHCSGFRSKDKTYRLKIFLRFKSFFVSFLNEKKFACNINWPYIYDVVKIMRYSFTPQYFLHNVRSAASDVSTLSVLHASQSGSLGVKYLTAVRSCSSELFCLLDNFKMH